MKKIEYTPKGSMCMVCAKKHLVCSDLPFNKFPIIEVTLDGIKIVKCVRFVRDHQRWDGVSDTPP